jgi:hypothetical protein
MRTHTATEFPAWQQGLQWAWDGVRSPWTSGLLATLVIFGMLMAFHDVVSGAVRQGEIRNKAIAAHVTATLRCNSLRDPHARDSCLLQLETAASAEGLLAAQNPSSVRLSSAQ